MSPAQQTVELFNRITTAAAAELATTTSTSSDMYDSANNYNNNNNDHNINNNCSKSSNNSNSSSSSDNMMPKSTTIKMMNYHGNSIMALIAMFMLCGCALFVTVDGLKCHMCGQYNEGVGSITPCLNYSDQYAHLYLKECSKKSEKFCVKYVSELSTVRDCATECVEKEIWATQTYCCNQDGCNGSSRLQLNNVLVVLLLPILYGIGKHIALHTLPGRR